MSLLDYLLYLRGRRLKPPTWVSLMPNAKLTWGASPSNPPQYRIQWYYNGTPAGFGLFNAAAQPPGGLQRTFADDNPGIALGNGDTIRAEVQAYNAATGAVSPYVSSNNVTL